MGSDSPPASFTQLPSKAIVPLPGMWMNESAANHIPWPPTHGWTEGSSLCRSHGKPHHRQNPGNQLRKRRRHGDGSAGPNPLWARKAGDQKEGKNGGDRKGHETTLGSTVRCVELLQRFNSCLCSLPQSHLLKPLIHHEQEEDKQHDDVKW
ncbi:hypothetical protein OPV22_004297 [Ensete ventricosum]|uniref:Uncharacterized protein n=1 Tax=Ensete ventricosum TaxID=4639 RepID=A0AAV8S3C8_ENSVE|nr:hypothetical protein OPV22_004297 [Ensete ventricosum]